MFKVRQKHMRNVPTNIHTWITKYHIYIFIRRNRRPNVWAMALKPTKQGLIFIPVLKYSAKIEPVLK